MAMFKDWLVVTTFHFTVLQSVGERLVTGTIFCCSTESNDGFKRSTAIGTSTQ